ncbi:Rho-binding antiterminator [Flammeovirga aprica]|uniref:Rho-binding antiterminator n=1 Tax=Flammeovirga aprica JL-4 TaxID=694437 RepID=A0A7X9NZ25_9BACT|nr:Rho-binding antiterminator [Flammeovirga aprica]NME66549.1 hypothetical protein [Flammeovirga aprica JL-4]
MSENKKYKPIACATYDQYEIWAMHGTVLHFQLKDREVKAKIKTLTVVDKVEYAVLDNEDKVRLDEIVEVSAV